MKRIFLALSLIIFMPLMAYSAAPSRLATYTSGATISSTDVTRNEDAIFNYLQNGVEVISDGSIANADISSSAAISASKLSLTSISQNITLTGSLTFTDGYLLDLSGVNASAATEGIKFPQATACTSATAEGQGCWDSDDDFLYFGNGTAATKINVRVKNGNTSRDTSTASGTQSVTGVGFKPTLVYFQGAEANSDEAYIGIDDGTTPVSLFTEDGVTADTWDFVDDGTASIFVSQSTGNTYAGKISSFDSDGFTITWTKTGSPTGTIAVDFVAIR